MSGLTQHPLVSKAEEVADEASSIFNVTPFAHDRRCVRMCACVWRGTNGIDVDSCAFCRFWGGPRLSCLTWPGCALFPPSSKMESVCISNGMSRGNTWTYPGAVESSWPLCLSSSISLASSEAASWSSFASKFPLLALSSLELSACR